MLKLNMPLIFKRLSTDRKVKLMRHILKVQGGKLQRLDYPSAAKELGVERPQIARDVRELEKLGLLSIRGGELQIIADLIKEE